MKRIRKTNGYTILEILIAVMITGILATSGFQFYSTMHNQTLTQEDISEMQHSSRVTLQEIAKTLRMAGYKLPDTHVPYVISSDTLWVFYGQTQPVDTVVYFLQETVDPYGGGGEMEEAERISPPMQLMKQVNSQTAATFAEGIQSISYTALDASNIVISVTTMTLRPDESYSENSGYRTLVTSERVKLRNVDL